MKKKYIDCVVYSEKNNYNSEINNILKKYPIPSFLHSIKIVAKNITEANNGLVYLGKDNNNKVQYIYGSNYQALRSINRLKIFFNVENKRKQIDNYINKELVKRQVDKYEDITIDTIFALILLIELTFYIRTGKIKYYKENNTVGLTTLHKKNFTINKNTIEILFKAKSSQIQKFVIYNNIHPILFKYITLLYNNTKNDDDLIFNFKGITFTEARLYKLLKNTFKIKLKDLRTYGVNRILILEFWKELYNNNDIKKSKIIQLVVKKTAEIIGHSVNVLNKSYILPELRDILLKIDKKFDSFDEYYKYIIDNLHSTH